MINGFKNNPELEQARGLKWRNLHTFENRSHLNSLSVVSFVTASLCVFLELSLHLEKAGPSARFSNTLVCLDDEKGNKTSYY